MDIRMKPLWATMAIFSFLAMCNDALRMAAAIATNSNGWAIYYGALVALLAISFYIAFYRWITAGEGA